jgi:hypothetical protein
MSIDDQPPIQQLGSAILIQGDEGLTQLARCVLAQIREVQRNGYSAEPYAQLLRTIHTARMSQPRHEHANCQLVDAHSNSHGVDDWISVAAAAEVLGVTRRQVQRLAPGLSPGQARRIGNVWALRSGAVMALSEERKRKAANGQR